MSIVIKLQKIEKVQENLYTRYPTNNPLYIVIKQPENLKDGGKTDHLLVGHAHLVPYK